MAGPSFSFASPITIPVQTDSSTFQLADMNNDGRLDLITAGTLNINGGAKISILLGNGNGTFQSPSQIFDFGSAVTGGGFNPVLSVGDLNRDGRIDLVLSRQNDAAIYIYNGNGNGTVGAATRVAMPAANSFNPVKNIVGDFNNDGWPDVAVGRFDDSRVIFFNGGPTFGATSRGVLLPNSNTPNLFATADFDQDGVTDLALATNTGVMVLRALNQASPQFSGYSNLITGGRFVQAMTVGRLLGTGGAPGITLASTSLSSSSQFIRIPTPLTQAQTYSYAAPFFLTSMTSGDFNGDGFDDIVSGSLSPEGFILGTGRNTGDIDINPTVVGASGFLSFGYQSGDLNGDGLLDFVAGGGELGARAYLQRVQSLTVTTAVDEDNGNAFADAGTGVSLREAFNYAKSLGGARTITFAPLLGNANAVLNLSGGDFTLPTNSNLNLTIENTAGRITIQQASGTFFTPFKVFATTTLTLRNITVSGFFSDLDDEGGAVYVGGGTLNVDRVTFRNNFAAMRGGAILSTFGSNVTIRNSTFTGNNNGALALNAGGGSVTLENNTFSGNTGVGAAILGGVATLNNNLFAGGNGVALSGGSVTGSNNLVQSGTVAGLNGTIVADPRLNALANNGGFTDTFSLQSDSQALDAATSLASVPTDQRGIARPQFGAPDIGAFEARPTELTLPTVTTADGAKWFLFGAVNNERRIFRQAPGQNAIEVGGFASFIALQGDGNVVVKQASGAVYTRLNSANGVGPDWSFRPNVKSSDNASWFLGTDGGGGNFNIYRWSASGAELNYAGGSGTRIGSLGGLIMTQNSAGQVYYRNGSNFALGDTWVENVRATAGDGATWFVLAPIGSNGSIVRWDTAGSFADSSGVGSALAVQQDGSILARNGTQIFTRLGSANGVGTNWSERQTVLALDSARWFFGTDGPSGQFNIYRWSGSQFIFTNGWGTRLSSVDGTIVHQNSGGAIYIGVGSASGPVSSWSQVNASVAGDGVAWLVAAPVGSTGSIFRWPTNSAPQPTGGSGVTLSTTPSGFIRTTTSTQQVFQRMGSATGIGTEWRLLTESLVITTAVDENDFSSTANLGAGTSLREALAYAESNPGPDTITFAAGLNGQTIASAFGWNNASDDTTLRALGDVTIDGGNQVTLTTAAGNTRRLLLSGGGTFTLRNLTISGVDSRGVADGAAVWTNGTVVIDNVRFQNNKATNGGAIANFGTLAIANSTFQENLATDSGGAIANGGTVSVSDSLLYLNSAINGGAINTSGTLAIGRTTFSGNAASFNGGALRLFGTATITDSTLSNNTAANGGGGLISHGSTTITNTTIAFNTALDGAGAQFFEGTAAIRHATIAYNLATRSGGGMAVNFADATLTSTLVAANAAVDQNDYWGAAPNAASAGNLINASATGAGLGTLASNGGPTQTIALLPGSPAINAGLAVAGITADQRGTARPQGSAADIGAYERVGTSATAQAASFESQTRQAIAYTFNADASVTFDRTSITLTNLTTNQPVNAGSLSWNAGGTQATLVLTNQLPDGNYRATTSGATGSTQVDFFVFAGDFNRNRTANFDDLLILAANYNQSGKDNPQGDANYDGVVNFDDLLKLAANYNASLASGATPAPIVVPPAVPGGGDASGSDDDGAPKSVLA